MWYLRNRFVASRIFHLVINKWLEVIDLGLCNCGVLFALISNVSILITVYKNSIIGTILESI